jgi:Cu/Ag efflux pump CusA
MAALSLVGVYLLLVKAVGSQRSALQVIANVPLAALGSIIALLIVNRPELALFADHPWYLWPRVWVEQTHLTLAHWVGFITLIGIVSRNGIMMISHYHHLMAVEGMPFGKEMIVRGSLERLAPVMMTAMTSFVGLIPLLFGAGEPGKELLYPLSVVLFGGMIASTALDQVVTPALFYLFGSPREGQTATGAVGREGAGP